MIDEMANNLVGIESLAGPKHSLAPQGLRLSADLRSRITETNLCFD